MKTVLHKYCLPKDSPQYAALKEALKGTRKFRAITNGEYLKTHEGPIELDPTNLFDNQWNSDKGRVFDWYEEYDPTGSRRGHYLEMTEEMIEARQRRYRCRFCGHQEDLEAPVWHVRCLGSEYLEPKQIHLAQMHPILIEKPEWLPVGDVILEAYEEVQRLTFAKKAVKWEALVHEDIGKAQRRYDITCRVNKVLLNSEHYRLVNSFYVHQGQPVFKVEKLTEAEKAFITNQNWSFK